jgi:NMD protein affecting ribosome stability and mRNA decay
MSFPISIKCAACGRKHEKFEQAAKCCIKPLPDKITGIIKLETVQFCVTCSRPIPEGWHALKVNKTAFKCLNHQAVEFRPLAAKEGFISK